MSEKFKPENKEVSKKVELRIDEIIGWYGTAAIVLAYALLSFGAIASANLA